MAEGIMGLAPGMGAPAAPQQAPQQASPDGMQAFLSAAGQMDSAEVEPQMDEALAEIDPALAQQIQAELSAIQLPPELIQILLDVVNGLLEAPEEYAQRRMQVIEAGLPADFLPEEFNLEYLSTLRYVLMRLPAQAAAPEVQGFKDGGLVSLKPIAKFLESQGRNGDTILAHINRSEAAMLKRMGGSGTVNPVTGLREYFLKKAWKSVTRAVSSVAKAIKKVVKPITDFTKKILANPIVRTVATVAAAVYLGPMAASAVGAGTGTALSAAVGTSIASTGVNLLAGEKPKDAIKQGLMAGTVAGVGAYAMGAPLTETVDYGLSPGIKDTVGKGIDAINPFSSSTPAVTADTEFAKLTSKGLPANAETYRLASESARAGQNILGMSPQTASIVIPTAATLVPPLLAYAGQEPPPTPEDTGIDEVSGPTGAELLASDPGMYGVNIGGTSSTYIDPYANLAAQDINLGATDGMSASPVMPNPAPGGIPPQAGFTPVLPSVPGVQDYTNTFAGYDPTKDPLSPQYNPFGAPSTGPATGGFNVAQGFAKGGIATLAKGGSVKTRRGGGQGSEAATANEQRYYEKLYGARSKASSSGSPSRQTEGQRATQQAALFREAQARDIARQKANARDAAERNARTQGIVSMAQKAAQEGRNFEFPASYASEQDTYRQAIQAARQSSPTSFMTPGEAEAYAAQQQSAAIAAERAALERQQQEANAVRAREEQAAAAKAKAEQELADFNAYKASVLSAPAAAPSVPSISVGASQPTAPAPSAPAASAPAMPQISIGAAAPAMPSAATPVYGPDGTQYESPAAAITAGVFNYASAPPAAGGIGALAPSAPAIKLPTLQASTTSPTNVPVAFANGGIAAMAPYKFKSGSNPNQNFPRRTGPINGPGTGTSDSIPAMLSDGEFVFTAKAVRGMGNGSRLKGAKKMYKMMKMLEGKS